MSADVVTPETTTMVVVDTDCGPKELRGQQLGAARLDVIKTACKAFPGLDPAACRLVTENGLCVDRAYIVTGKCTCKWRGVPFGFP
jgi:hypothetical protein